MIRPLLLPLIAFSTLFCNAQKSKVDTTLKMLTYGMPHLNEDRAADVVAKKYGFTYYVVADCSITKKLKDSVEKENKRVSTILEQRFGIDWKKTFYKEVDTMMKLQAQVEALVKSESYIVAKRNEGHWFSYFIDPTDRPNVFAVKAYDWGIGNECSKLFIYFKLTVDLTTNVVTKNSDTIELLEHN